jgi:hypothetical protein
VRVHFSTYWMTGLAPHPANFFKFLLVLVLYTISMTLFVTFLFSLSFSFSGLTIHLAVSVSVPRRYPFAKMNRTSSSARPYRTAASRSSSVPWRRYTK